VRGAHGHAQRTRPVQLKGAAAKRFLQGSVEDEGEVRKLGLELGLDVVGGELELCEGELADVCRRDEDAPFLAHRREAGVHTE